MLWAVKQSLLEYIAGAHGGAIELDGVENDAGLFSFPLASIEGIPGEGSGVARATGTVRLFGHFRMPIQKISDPWVEWDGGDAVLTVLRWPGRTARLPAWDLRPLVLRDGELRAGLVRLLDAGGELFGGQYPPGTEFDPLLVRL
ncbi:hypothetical protein BH11ACT4_BH11ACT4_13500 [soil metagenome]